MQTCWPQSVSDTGNTLDDQVVNKYLFIVWITCCQAAGHAQDFRNIFVDESDHGRALSELLTDAEEENGVDFIFDENKMRALTALRIEGKKRLLEYLSDYLLNYDIIKVQDNVVVIVDKAY
jgi:hypothetical protein